MKKILFCFLPLVTACAMSEEGGTGDYDTYAHPATSVNDQFHVEKVRPKRPAQNAEFFFKSCSRGSARWPSRTSEYDCDYPF